MLNKIKSLGLALLLGLSFTQIGSAQTSGVIPPPPPNPTNSFTTTLWQDVNPLLHATNYSVEPYATYAPAIHKVGGGVFVAYNINQYVGTGVALDYCGQFSVISANCQFQYAMHPFSFAPNFAIVPFAMAGVGQGMSGAVGSGIITADAGGYFSFGELWGGHFNAGAAYGAWENAGPFSGKRYHIFAGWSLH